MKTPELDKMTEVNKKHNTQDIGAFLENTEYVLAEWMHDENFGDYLIPVNKSIETILAEHFGVDLDKVEQERRALLDEIRGGEVR